MSELAEEAVPATLSDISEAIENLSNEDSYRILAAAKSCLPGTHYLDPRELYHEVVMRCMNAATGEGQYQRIWTKDVPFVAFVMMTMKGLSDDSRNLKSQKTTLNLEPENSQDENFERIHAKSGRIQEDFVSQAISDEEIQVRKQKALEDIEKIQEFFKDADDVNWVIMGRQDGLKPGQICELSDMNRTQYDSALRRLRRGLNKLFPDRSTK